MCWTSTMLTPAFRARPRRRLVLATAQTGDTSATMEGRAVQLDGATSGSVTLAVPAVAGANTATLPGGDRIRCVDRPRRLLTNKTLGGTTPINRLRANQGSATVVGDWSLVIAGLGSWGSTASVVSVSGNDTAGSVNISCSGTGQSANPGFKLTFHDGHFPRFL